MVHQSVLFDVASGCRAAQPASYHVALDTMMARRSRHRPEEVAIDGFLLFDTGTYELVTAHIPLDVFWRMKALDILGHVRSENRAKSERPGASPQVGSVWSVEGALEAIATRSNGGERIARDEADPLKADAAKDVLTATPGEEAGTPADKAFRLHVIAVYALDRVAIEAEGPRFIETLHVRDMLPAIGA